MMIGHPDKGFHAQSIYVQTSMKADIKVANLKIVISLVKLIHDEIPKIMIISKMLYLFKNFPLINSV